MRVMPTGCFCVLLFVLYATLFGAVATKCSSTSSCPGIQYCCRRNNVCLNNCIDEPCSYLTQCARGKYCCDGKCSLNCSSCFYDLHCPFLETCCGPLSVGENLNSTCKKSSCLGKLCVDNYDCPGFLYCCAGISQFECSYCHNDTECSSGEVCCGLHLYNEGHCAKSCDGKSDCRSGEICCDLAKNSVGTCIKSCIGKSCGITLWDRIFERTCASGERCCRFSKRRGVNCIGEACTSNSHCAMGETCCDRANGTGKFASSCIGKSCKRYGSHCATREDCCGFNGTSGLNCIGQVCLSDIDCAPKETCCGVSDGNKGTCGRFCAGKSCKDDSHCASGEYCCGANATCASKCAEQMCTRRHHCGTGEFCCGNAPSSLRKCAKSCINISCTYNSQCASGENGCWNQKCALSCRGKRCTFYWNCAQGEPVVPDYVFRDVKIVNIVGLMNLAVVKRDVQVCVVDLVLEIDVKIMKIAHQVNIVLESISKCVATTGNVDLRHATQKRKLKVKLVGELQLA